MYTFQRSSTIHVYFGRMNQYQIEYLEEQDLAQRRMKCLAIKPYCYKYFRSLDVIYGEEKI